MNKLLIKTKVDTINYTKNFFLKFICVSIHFLRPIIIYYTPLFSYLHSNNYENILLSIFVLFPKYNDMQKPLLEILAENVKYYRAKTGMSQLKFAVQLDISPSYLNDIECGRQYASLKMLERFAHEFNIETYQLLIPKGVSQDEVLRSEYEEQLRNLKEQVVDLFDKQLKKKTAETD